MIKKEKVYKRYIILLLIIYIVLIAMTTYLLVNNLKIRSEQGDCIEAHKHIDTTEYKIPTDKWISDWCQENGYTTGWLSGTCDAGVTCLKERDGYKKYDCLTLN